MSECLICGNPVEDGEQLCVYCELVQENNHEGENMNPDNQNNQDSQPKEGFEYVAPTDATEPSAPSEQSVPAQAEIVQSQPEAPADVPTDNGEQVAFKVILVKDDEGAAKLEQAFNDGYLLSQGQPFGEGVVQIMTKVTPKAQQ